MTSPDAAGTGTSSPVPRRPCMTPDEARIWGAANAALAHPAPSPCVDCPLEFALAMRRLDHCDGEPGGLLRTPAIHNRTGRQGKRYATEEERVAARRATWRESKARHRAIAA